MRNNTDSWRTGSVIRGDQTGRTLGFPTANFDPSIVSDIEQEGVYAAAVLVSDTEYRGALYFGPRLTLGETKRVLEIHLLDFNGDLYGKELRFSIGSFIRPPMNFESEAALKEQLTNDILAVRRIPV